jgi:probable phosphoglycerate mutase
MRLYFIRHGQSVANVRRVISNRDEPFPLTDLGREQAGRAAEALAGEGVTQIFSSPLQRARETAEILSARLGVAWEPADALREFDCGDYELRSDDAVWDEFAELWRRWNAGDHGHRFPGGESLLDIRARFDPFIAWLAERYGASGARVVLVGHGGLFHSMLPLALANVDLAYAGARQIDHTHAVVAELRGGELRCLSWCGEALP